MSPPERTEREPDSGRDEPPPRRTALIAIAVILALAVAGWWISVRLHQANSLQDCVMQGRRNCAPVN